MVMAGSEVVLVHRNFTDSFRVGKDGCTNDSKVCPSSSTCQPHSGLCLCRNLPNFLNPANGYKCVRSEDIIAGLDGLGVHCGFTPFQLIPYTHSEPATEFTQTNKMTSCSLDKSRKPQAKFPNITNNTELQWLDDSYVQFSVSNKILSFKWTRSVPELRGTIITLYPRCKHGDSYRTFCLRAKVIGTWPPDQNPTEVTAVSTAKSPPAPTAKRPTTVTSAKPSSTETTEPNTPGTTSTTDDVNLNVTTARPSTPSVHSARPPKPSVHSSPPGKSSGSDGGSSGTVIIIAAVVPVVMLIIVVAVPWWVCKGRTENKERNSWRGRPSRKKDIREGKELTQRGTNGTKSLSAAQSNYGYSAAGDASVIAEASPTYDATPSTVKKQAIHDIPYPTEPGYDTPDLKRVQARAKNEKEEVDSHYYSTLDDNFKGKEDDAQYSTPDIERVNVNGNMYALPDKSKKNKKKEVAARNYSTPENNVKSKENTAPYSKPDIERVEVNGDMYALPDKSEEKKKKEIAALYYSTPENKVKSKESTAQYSKPDIKRVEVNGDMYALPDKSEKNKKGKRLDYLDSSQLYSDTQDKYKTSGESTLYAEIDEAVRPPQKKKK